ncbi:MAG: cysteine--tRNA ligase [Thermoanaerobaculia bacterium]
MARRERPGDPVTAEQRLPLRLYNTLTRRIEAFEPLREGEVRLYTCGPTVYDRAHIGNLRTFLFEDLLRRTLAVLGYRVVQVMNLTDVDDKTIAGARQRGVSLDEFTQPFIDTFFEDLDTLHVERAEEYPRATRHIPQMIELIVRLEGNGLAYRQDGSVFFRVGADPGYGRLLSIDPEQLRQGERVADDEYGKEDVRDFVLWKGAKPGEPSWESPWGPGRPGWHIECSAMSMHYLGETLDLHCGGVDNVFPHHENEIAQSEGATGKPFARTWLHSEHLIVDGEKMSKSLGNQFTLPQLLERGAAPRALRYLLLSVHYRQKLNFTFEALAAAAAALARVDELRFRIRPASGDDTAPSLLDAALDEFRDRFLVALADDLNVSAALASVHGLVRGANRAVEAGAVGPQRRDAIIAALAEADRVFGVLDAEPWETSRVHDDQFSADEIERLLDERRAARAGRDFARADEIRDELTAAGIEIQDSPEGTRWRRL